MYVRMYVSAYVHNNIKRTSFYAKQIAIQFQLTKKNKKRQKYLVKYSTNSASLYIFLRRHVDIRIGIWVQSICVHFYNQQSRKIQSNKRTFALLLLD